MKKFRILRSRPFYNLVFIVKEQFFSLKTASSLNTLLRIAEDLTNLFETIT